MMDNQRNTLYWLLLSVVSVIALIILSAGIWWTDKIAETAKPQTDALRKELGQ